MTTAAYYNEIDPFAAQWLRNLIAGGHIAPGEIDERSIEDVTPDDLRGFTQCHFFAGIGVWSHSLRLAGWPDDKPVWTGSCPCQPFSAAGKGDGFADERHLWPHFFHLISERRPQHVFGEQVASGNTNTWFDLVQADLEGMGYAFGLVPFTSAGIGAPHIRERAYWVAHAHSQIDDRRRGVRSNGWDEHSDGSHFNGMAYSNHRICDEGETLRTGRDAVLDGSGINRLANATGQLHHQCNDGTDEFGWARHPEQNRLGSEPVRALEVNGFWRDADWLLCRDGKWRPVEPGTFPLVDGAAARLGRVEPGVARLASSNRVGRLKGYGNAINAQAAAEFIRAYMEGL
ncbi:DNA cytosine methyltransferase [Enterobacter hormaechei]|uniref:DNA cytosine methyltransferase n=1 Tax=Enterobacter hormaechei TaxID=158836 RepID=UPI000CD121C7|nr:DNA cytosine methyltransferase [Enterobacter hormaechei]MCO7991317.1 DNA cytosine methyltransferase [Enterobacter hormaechei]MCO8001324.1 DNA cytosine methyltransferase [Enterobacter hormaechei]MCO8014348.1 DNA cytosine methyltransferase [Enterobacter hormaechei]PNY63123.1 DNA cytosine methyltransferase [Enterobacter cloacae]